MRISDHFLPQDLLHYGEIDFEMYSCFPPRTYLVWHGRRRGPRHPPTHHQHHPHHREGRRGISLIFSLPSQPIALIYCFVRGSNNGKRGEVIVHLWRDNKCIILYSGVKQRLRIWLRGEGKSMGENGKIIKTAAVWTGMTAIDEVVTIDVMN